MPTGQALLDQMARTPIIPNSLALWGMGQMGIAIKGPDGLLYIDVCLSDIVVDVTGDQWWHRAYDPPLQPEQLTNATCILASHEHLDHLDTQTVGRAAKANPDATFIVTGWCLALMAEVDIDSSRIVVPQEGQPMAIPGTSATLTAVRAAHYDLEHDAEKGYRWFGYIIDWNGVRFYHSGDTIIFPGYEALLRAHSPIDVAMLAVNGRDHYREADRGIIGNLWGSEAARLASDLGWTQVIVGHNDLYPNNMIPVGSIAEDFARVAPRQPYKVLQPGELYYFVR